MNWFSNFLHQLSNLLTKGALRRYQRQATTAQLKLEQTQLELEDLRAQLRQIQTELEQTQIQLEQAQMVMPELKLAQERLQKTETELVQFREQLQQAQGELEQCQAQRQQAQMKLAQPRDWLREIRQKVEILDVKRLPQENPDSLRGFGIGLPKPKTQVTCGSIIIKGWVLGKKSAATTVRITCNDRILEETPVNQPRPFLAKKYPEVAGAENNGFETSVAVVGMPPGVELILQAVLEDESCISMGVIRLGR